MSSSTDEPLLKETYRRYVLFPIQYDGIWSMYKTAQAAFWTAEEIDFNGDLTELKKLPEQEQRFITRVIAFSAASNKVIYKDLVERLSSEIQAAEARCFYGFQIMMRNVHTEANLRLVDAYTSDEVDRKQLLTAIEGIGSVRRKADWAKKWFDGENSTFATRVLALAAVEAIFFSGIYASIFWLNKQDILGLKFSNKLINKDEGLHIGFSYLLFSMLKQKPSTEIVKQIITEAVDIQLDTLLDDLPLDLIEMDPEKMRQYIKFVADRLLIGFDQAKAYDVQNPFDFKDDAIASQQKPGASESRSSQNPPSVIDTDKFKVDSVLDENF